MKSESLSKDAGHVREFFLARQPILDRLQGLVAYELLFRDAAVGPAHITNDLSATAAVIAHAAQLGVDKVIGETIGFLNVDASVLMSDIFAFLPREKVVLELVESTRMTSDVVARIAHLSQQGFRFALNDVIAESADFEQLLPYVDILKIDLHGKLLQELPRIADKLSATGKKLLAEKVEERTQYETCFDLGFDYFQGYYFAKPAVLSGKKLSPSQLAIMDLMGMINADAQTHAIERVIKKDVALCFNLLRLVNTPAIGIQRRVDSIGQALLVLGRRQLLRWLQILLYSECGHKGRSMTPLLTLATTRGRLLELMAAQLKPRNPAFAETAFTVGIMSLMDTLFGIPMDEILDQLAVSDKVRLALLYRGGYYGDLLKVAECIERIDESGPQLRELLERLQLDSEQLRALQLAAFEWSDKVAQATH